MDLSKVPSNVPCPHDDTGMEPDVSSGPVSTRLVCYTCGKTLQTIIDKEWNLPIHRTEAGYPNCSTCDGGGCYDCTDPA